VFDRSSAARQEWSATARTLSTSLDLGNPRTNLRGRKREQLIAWLGRR